MFIVVMGVAGSGKTTLGRALSDRLGWPMQEGDDLHPPANVEKMRAGIPLTDDDRAPWLAKIAGVMSAWKAQNVSAVICCSALKARYRDILRGADPQLLLVYLHIDPKLSTSRLATRSGHYMPASLVASQFEALEEPLAAEHALRLEANAPLEGNVAAVVAAVTAAAGSVPARP